MTPPLSKNLLLFADALVTAGAANNGCVGFIVAVVFAAWAAFTSLELRP